MALFNTSWSFFSNLHSVSQNISSSSPWLKYSRFFSSSSFFFKEHFQGKLDDKEPIFNMESAFIGEGCNAEYVWIYIHTYIHNTYKQIVAFFVFSWTFLVSLSIHREISLRGKTILFNAYMEGVLSREYILKRSISITGYPGPDDHQMIRVMAPCLPHL